MIRRTDGILVAAALLLAAVPLAGQSSSAAQTTDAHPNWTGVYRRATNADLGSTFKPLNPNLDTLSKAHLQPWAILKMQQTNGAAEDRGALCQPDGLFRQFQGLAGFIWLPAGDKIILPSTDLPVVGVRRIYLTDKHPKYLSTTWLGHSIGHWDGDTLVVDTIGFNDKTWMMSGMEPHTEDLHLVERIKAVGDGSMLEFTTTADDRRAFTSEFTYTRYFKKTGGEYVEDLCNSEPGDMRMWNTFRRNALRAPRPGAAPSRPGGGE